MKKKFLLMMMLSLLFTAMGGGYLYSQELLVNCDYNSSVEGYGTTKFSNYAGAYAYATANAKNATIVIEKTNTLSGNTFDNNHKNYSRLAVVIKDGATMGNALSKWDMTYPVTVEPGGTLTCARPKTASVSNIHIKNTLTVGAESSTKKAIVDFLSDTYQDCDISIRYNGKILVYNADFRVQDLDAQGSLTITDSEVYVDGAFASATFYATKLTNTEMVVNGNQISGGLSDFAGVDSNQLGNVTLNNSTITIYEGTTKVAANVTATDSEINVNDLTINNGKKVYLEEGSVLDVETLNIVGTGSVVPDETSTIENNGQIIVAMIGQNVYTSLADALAAASAMTGDVTVEIYENVTLNLSLSGSYSSIKFVGKDTDAEIYLDVDGYITATGKKVAFEDLTLSKSEGGFITNAGFMNVAFGVYDVTEVTYTNCVFDNGACASSGKVTYTGCTFKRSHDKYGLWAYGNVDVTVNGCTFADYRGIKMYAEGAAKTVDLTVENTDFSAVTDKPAIVLTYGEKVTLQGNTYSSTGTFELDLDGAPNGTTVTSDVDPICINDNGACGVLVNDKIYTTVAQAAEVATSGSTVTLLHNSTETVVLPMGVILDKNEYEAAGVTVAEPIAKIGDTYYKTLQEAIDACEGENNLITLLNDITFESDLSDAAKGYFNIADGKKVVLDMNGKTINVTDKSTGNFIVFYNYGEFTVANGTINLNSTNDRDWNAESAIFLNRGGIFNIENGTYTHNGGTDMAFVVDNSGNFYGDATTNIYEKTLQRNTVTTTLTSSYIAIRNRMEQNSHGASGEAILNVYGGTISGTSRAIWAQAASTSETAPATGEINVNGGNIGLIDTPRSTGAVSMTTISGGEVSAFKGEVGELTVTGGTLNEVTLLTAAGETVNDYVVNEDGLYVQAVAKVGETKYATLALAVAAVEDGGTITLIANETFTENNRYNNGGWWDGLGYSGDKSFTIDLGGFTIGQDGALNDYLMWFKNDGAKANTITLKNGILDAGTTAYCALATASSNAQKITVNLENISLINNKSDGSTVKVRGGAELNVKDGTVITGKDSYLGVECSAATINIYDGAEIYMNGTSSYNGCLAGVGSNGTINVYGGEGEGKSGGFIAMTSGGTINVEGGEWTANTDGTYANDNKSVLVAQSANGAKSIVNVTGGTFKGGYNCYGAAVGDAQINIKGGNFNANPTSYVADGYVAVENNGVWNVTKAAAKIGATYYATLQAAIDAAQDGEEIDLLKDVELTSPLLLTKNNILDGNGFKLTPAEGGFTPDGNYAVIVLAANMSGYEANRTYTVKNLTIEGFSTPSRIVRANFCDATIQNCIFDKNNSESIITSAYAVLNVEDNTFTNNTTSFAVINVGSDVSDGTNLKAEIKGNKFYNNEAATAGIYLASSANVTGNHFKGNTHTGDNANAAAILAGPYTGNMAYTVNIKSNAFENAMSKGGTALPSVFAEDWSANYGSTTSFDLSLNYWDGNEPVAGIAYKTSGDNPQVTVKSYYKTYTDGTLGGLIEYPQGNNFNGYTRTDAIWGEVWGNAKVSFVVKVLDANDNVMGTTSLNNIGGIIDGDVNVTWTLKLDAASNTDEYWTMNWTTAPTINNMPAKVELWVDGVKVSGGPVVLNAPDNLSMIYAAVTDAEGKILSYHTSIADAVAAAQQGNTIALLRNTDEEIKLPFGVTLNLNGFDAPNVTFTLPTAMIGETEYASVADALAAAQAANLADVVITIIGENTAATADNFSLIYENKFDKVTFKQNNGGKVYYFNELYTGSRTNNGEFVFDGVNLVVTGQYMFEGNVKLSNNSFVKSTAEANCFVYNAEVTVEAGSKIDGVIEDIRGGSLIIDGGKTDGTYCSEPGLRDAILTVNWTNSNLVLKNGAYVKVNSANEVGRLTVNGEMRVTDSKLESYQWILVNENATLTLNAGSDITTQKVNGAGNIIVDVTGLEGQATVIKGDMTGFTGTITVDRGFYTVTADGLVVERGLSGKGTEAEPYLITDADELHLFRQSVNAGETRYNTSDVWVVLNADINLDVTRSASNWEPIGTFDYSFDGNFDGKGHIIKNLKIYDNTTAANGEAYLGFFGVTANNTIKNFVIENVTIESEGQIVAAAIAYPYYTEVSDITVKGDIKIKGGNYTAGVLAYTRLCQKASNLTVSGNEGSYIEGAQTVGGVIADIQMNYGLVADYSNFTAEGLTIKGTKSVGGISGIIAAQTLNGATVNNVTLNCEDDRVGIVSGALGGASTITNVTVENVTGATNIVGATYDGAKPIAAKIGDTYYGTLANALAADGEESVELLAPITIAVGETVVYNLNGKTVVATDNATGNYAMITNKGNLTIEGEGKLQLTATNNRGWSAYSSVISNTVGGKLTVNGGTIEHLGGTDMAYAIDNLTNGQGTYAETIINGGTMKSPYRAIRQFLNGTEAENILTVNGGTIEGANKSIWMQDPNTYANSGALTVTEDAKLFGDVNLTVTAGSTEWPVEVAIAAAALQGESTVLTSNVPENYIVKNNNGVWGVFSAVASVNGVNYATLLEAFDAAQDGDEIVVLKDITYTKANGYVNVNSDYIDGLVYTGDKSFTVDFGGYTITDNGEINDYLVYLKNQGEKDNEITFKNGKIAIKAERTNTAWAAITVGANSATHKTTLNLNEMEVVNGNPNEANNQVIRTRNGATVNLNDGTVVTSNGTSYGVVAETGSTVNINSDAKVVHTNSSGTTGGNLVYTAVSGNGIINIYDGAIIESDRYAIHNMTSGNTVINIYGGTITAPVAVHVATNGGGDESAVANISGGTFTGLLETYSGAASIVITGGTFSVDPTAYCAQGYSPIFNGSTYTVIQTAGTQTRELPLAGWYWFSTYIDIEGINSLSTLQNALFTENQEGNTVCVGEIIKSRTQYSQYFPGAGWGGTLESISTAQMYMIKTNAPVTLELSGDFVEEGRVISLNNGWNSIGYPVRSGASIEQALSGFTPTEGDVLKSKTATSFYEGGIWFPSINLEPGHGYMYKSVGNKTLVYTSNNNNSTAKTDVDMIDYRWNANATQYSGNMTIVAMLSIDNEMMKGDYEISAFANGECRGTARPTYNEKLDAYILVLTVQGDDVEELSFKYYDVNYGTEYELANTLVYSNDAIVGSLDEPYMFNLDILNVEEASINDVNVYPNPTTTNAEIDLNATCDKVEVFNALGVKVAEYSNVDSIDALETAGVYVIRVTIDGNVRNCRLVVK